MVPADNAMRRHFTFACQGFSCGATIDEPPSAAPLSAAQGTGLLIVTGGNEIRSGAHRNQAQLAAAMAQRGHPVMRYDRRGTGDSEGANGGWRHSADDIAAAAAAFRHECPGMARIVAFGNCDAASALLLFGRQADIDAIVIANPWTYDHDGDSEPEATPAARSPDAAHARAHYLRRLANPIALARDLLSGGVDIGKALRGVGAILKGEQPSDTGASLAKSLALWGEDATLLLSDADRTAVHFCSQMKLARARLSPLIIADGSHSFVTAEESEWLYERVTAVLRN